MNILEKIKLRLQGMYMLFYFGYVDLWRMLNPSKTEIHTYTEKETNGVSIAIIALVVLLLLLLIGLSHADNSTNSTDPSMTPGQCLTDALSNITYCSVAPNLGINITLNASDPSNDLYYNFQYGIYILAIGNETIVQNVTNVIVQNITFQGCNATINTLASNTTGVFNNQTVFCEPGASTINNTIVNNITISGCPADNKTVYANSTIVDNNVTFTCLSNTGNGACAFSDTVAPSASDQYEQNITGLHIHILPVPFNFCYQNVNEQIGQNSLYNNGPTNITITSALCANYQPPSSCPVCPAVATAPDCNASIEAAAAEAQLSCTEQLGPTQVLLAQAQANLTAQSDLIKSIKNNSADTSAQVQQQVSDSTWWVPYLVLALIGSVLIWTANFIWTLRNQRRLTHTSGIAQSFTAQDKAHFSQVGKDADNVWKRKTDKKV